MKAAVAGGIVGAVVLVVALLYLNHQFTNQREAFVKSTREAFELAIRHADSLAAMQKDSIVIIEGKAAHVREQAKERIDAVRATRSVDSLIILYFRFRADPGTRFRDGGS